MPAQSNGRPPRWQYSTCWERHPPVTAPGGCCAGSGNAHLPGCGPAVPLSGRETQVAGLVVQGLSNAEVAARLFISHRTVTTHLERIYRRLGISSRAELARLITAMSPDEIRRPTDTGRRAGIGKTDRDASANDLRPARGSCIMTLVATPPPLIVDHAEPPPGTWEREASHFPAPLSPFTKSLLLMEDWCRRHHRGNRVH